MPYVDENLSPGEEIRYRAKVHWSIYIPTVVTLVFGIIIWFSQNREGIPLLIILCIALL